MSLHVRSTTPDDSDPPSPVVFHLPVAVSIVEVVSNHTRVVSGFEFFSVSVAVSHDGDATLRVASPYFVVADSS